MNGQRLNGKWLETKDGHSYSMPKIQILEFGDDLMSRYDFDKSLSVKTYNLVNDELIVDGKAWGKVSFINKDRFRLLVKGARNQKDTLVEIDYVRLKPTISELEKNEIERMSYDFRWNGEDGVIMFNEDYSAKNSEGETTCLETIDSTLFVSIFRQGRRETIIPIKKVTSDYLELYGMPYKPYVVIASSLK